MSKPAIVLALVLAAVGSGAGAQDEALSSRSPAVGLGPLLLRSQSPLNILRLSPIPLAPLTLEKGEWLTGAVFNWDNYFDADPAGRYVVDAESVGVTLGAAYGLTSRVDVGLALPVSHRSGGTLDGFIEGFESWIGVPNETRRRAPRDRFLVQVRGEDGEVHELGADAAGWGLEDGTLMVRYQLAEGSRSRPAILVGVGASLPVGDRHALRSTGSVDAMVGVSAAQRIGRCHLYGSLSWMRYARTRFFGVRLRDSQGSALAALEVRTSPRTSVLLQGLVTSSAAERFGDFAKNTYEIALGVKHVLARRAVLEVSLLENLFIFDNSPDVGFHVGVTWHLPARRRAAVAQRSGDEPGTDARHRHHSEPWWVSKSSGSRGW